MVTHAPRRNIINIYTSMPWENLCAEVAKLRIALPQDAEIIPLRRAVNAESPEIVAPGPTTVAATVLSAAANSSLSLLKSEEKTVEAPGVESARRLKILENARKSGGLRGRFSTIFNPEGHNADEKIVAFPVPEEGVSTGQRGGNSVRIPSGPATLADVLESADRAMLEGDVHRARRLLATARERAEGGDSDRATVDTSGTRRR